MSEVQPNLLQKLLARPQSRRRRVLEWTLIYALIGILLPLMTAFSGVHIVGRDPTIEQYLLHVAGLFLLAGLVFSLKSYLAFLRIGVDLRFGRWLLFGTVASLLTWTLGSAPGWFFGGFPPSGDVVIGQEGLQSGDEAAVSFIHLAKVAVEMLFAVCIWIYFRRVFISASNWLIGYILLNICTGLIAPLVIVTAVSGGLDVLVVAAYVSPALRFVSLFVLGFFVINMRPKPEFDLTSQSVEAFE